MKGDALDPKALIREAYKIEGIDASQCRTIFLDWALGVPLGADTTALVHDLLERYAKAAPDHPMTIVLQQAVVTAKEPRRRGGRSARLRS